MKMKRKPVKASRRPMSASASARKFRKVCASMSMREKEDAFEWMDFGNDILRAAIKYKIKIEDYVCDPKLPEIHFLVYMMSTYEYAINIDVVGGKILIEKANAEDDYLQRYSCDSINEALSRIYDLFKSTVQFGKWTAVKSSKYNHFARKVNASKRTGKRSIMAGVDRVDRDFMRFLRELETDLQNNESEYITLGAYDVSPSVEGGHTYEIMPYYNGYQGHDFYDVIMIDTEPSGEITAYSKDNGDVIAQGYSFNDIRFNCYNWLKETLIDIYENIPDYEDED